MFNNVISCLQERGFIEAITSEEVVKRALNSMRVYTGFDPSADSLHLGNLVGIIALRWMQKYGHTPVVILGGATGRIGDPSGKSVERPLLDNQTIASNCGRIAEHFKQILDFSSSNAPLILNNEQWFSDYSFIDFLRDIGKHFRIGPMLAKESIRSRLQSEEGISYTEFSYLLLQAYDFHYLHEKYDVCLQMGGSDQWGNITAGIELIRKLTGKSSYGLTFPLLTRSDGKKFGKSEEGAIWLSPDRCSPYQFYQYLFRISDADVIKLMRMLTFMPMEEIRDYEHQMQVSSYVPNTAQKKLAEEVTRIVHGEKGLDAALRVTQGVVPGGELKAEMLEQIAKDMPNVQLQKAGVFGGKFVDLAVQSGLVSSKGEAHRLIQNGGAYLNDQKVDDVQRRLSQEDLIGGKYLLFGAGKKKKILIILI